MMRSVFVAGKSSNSPIYSITKEFDGPFDIAAQVIADHGADSWTHCMAQPDRDWSLIGIGCAAEVLGQGQNRFESAASSWRQLLNASQVASKGDLVPSLTAVGGFSFAATESRGEEWSDFPQISFVVPEILLIRDGSRTTLTCTVSDGDANGATAKLAATDRWLERMVARDSTTRETNAVARNAGGVVRARGNRRFCGAGEPMVTPVHASAVTAPCAERDFLTAVKRTRERIIRGDFEKLVIARGLDLSSDRPYEIDRLFTGLCQRFAQTTVFAFGRGDSWFIGATPERLIKIKQRTAQTMALAGSIRRGTNEGDDIDLGLQLLGSTKDQAEHEIVARRLISTLTPLSHSVAVEPTPQLLRLANVMHLHTPVEAQLREDISTFEVIEQLHPTPAVGAEPASAIRYLSEFESIDRGWYSGGVGWLDGSGDAEFSVALRCGLIHGRSARLYAGAGIVRDSDPETELHETTVKLNALLPLLLGSARNCSEPVK